MIIAAVATAVVHALVFLSLIGLAVLEIIAAPTRVVAPPPPEVTVEIRPEMFERPAEVPASPPDPMKPQQVRTSLDQESEIPPEKTNLIGEHTTRAASELPPDPNAVRLPSQDGEEPRQPGRVETVSSSFSDGEEPDQAVVPPMEEQPPAGDPTLKPDPSESMLPGETTASEAPPPPGGTPEELLLKTPNQVPVPEMEDGEKPRDPESLPKESEAESESEAAKPAGGAPDSKAVEEQPPRDTGFRSEVRKTRLQGSISRIGNSSRDVENTPLGRYQAKLSRAVEREWQRSCIRYREHITPGMLTIRFLVDERGRVSSFRFIEVVESSEIQKGFTLKSIQSADIPRMPKDIARGLDGDPLELIYNFFF